MPSVIPTVIIPVVDNELIEFYWNEAMHAAQSVAAQTVRPELIVSLGTTLADAKNRGVKQATTEWCMFLDADDSLDPEYVSNLRVDENAVGILRPKCLLNGRELRFGVSDLFVSNFLINACAFKREHYEAVGGAEDIEFADWQLWAKLFITHGMLLQDVDSLYLYNKRPDGLNARDTAAGHSRVLRSIQQYGLENGGVSQYIPTVINRT